LVAAALFVVSCSTVAVTGRSQLNLIPASTMLSMSYQQYGEFMQTHPVSRDQSKVQMVQRVGVNIKNSVESYFKQKGLSDQLQGYKWEFNLVESAEVNAWCMPGGKVVVYSGILPITQNEIGLAVVMGHEIAHAIAEHGSERMSQGLLTQLGGMALNEALANKPEETRALWMTAFGVGAQVGVLLPYSRLHESEADKLGLIFMAMAGYNPNEAVSFWQRMAANKSGSAPPEFLSTHPSDATRIKDLQAAMPEAMTYYKK
jgi:predicted Zn-dependent protease